MDNPTEGKVVVETKPDAPAHSAPPMNRLAASRLANKERKKRAHHRKLRRSNTKG